MSKFVFRQLFTVVCCFVFLRLSWLWVSCVFFFHSYSLGSLCTQSVRATWHEGHPGGRQLFPVSRTHVKMSLLLWLLLLCLTISSFLKVNGVDSEIRFDSNGYVLYCPCMGKFKILKLSTFFQAIMNRQPHCKVFRFSKIHPITMISVRHWS